MTRKKAILFGGLLLFYAWFVHFWPTFHAANEAIRMYFVAAVVDHGTASVDPLMEKYKVGNVDRAEYEGRAYMDKAPGLSLVVMPFYWALTRMGMSTDRAEIWRLWYLLLLIGVSVPALFGVWCVFDIVHRWTDDERAAWVAALALGLASPFALYSTVFFGHGPAAVLAIASFWALTKERIGLAGLFAGGMVLVDTATAMMAVILGLYATARKRSLEDMLRFGIGGTLGVAIQLAYNSWCFGDPLTFAYKYKASSDLAAIHEQGLYGFVIPGFEALFGLTFGGMRGLFFHAPVLLLGLLGGRRVLWVICGVYFLWIASFVDWSAGASYAPRHLVPITPFLAVGVGLAAARRPELMWAAGVLGVVSFLAIWPAMATFPYAPMALTQPLTQLAIPMAIEGEWARTLLGLPALGSVVLAAALVIYAVRPTWPGLVVAASGLAVTGALFLLEGEPTEAEVGNHAAIGCLVEYEDSAAARCLQLDKVLDPRRCRCRVPRR